MQSRSGIELFINSRAKKQLEKGIQLDGEQKFQATPLLPLPPITNWPFLAPIIKDCLQTLGKYNMHFFMYAGHVRLKSKNLTRCTIFQKKKITIKEIKLRVK